LFCHHIGCNNGRSLLSKVKASLLSKVKAGIIF
jgi:hypothetical protein